MALWRIIQNFFFDGTKAFSVLAPTLSILYTAGKVWEWPVTDAWKELSYAWALAPILLLAFVAYYRRWRYSRSLEGNRDMQAAVDALSDFLDQGNNDLFNKMVTNDSEHMKWASEWGAWCHTVEDHLDQFFSRAERNGFRNLVTFDVNLIRGSYNEVHNWQRCQLKTQLDKIRGITIRYSTVGKTDNGAR